ncbi:MAG: adenosine deaminase [Acidobacteria bacterium]|nr:adenosine deaminase [Acidobacteriota bacterium]
MIEAGRRFRRALAATAVASIALCAAADSSQQPAPADAAEAATARRFATIRDQPAPLREFLREMPKGGDLHMHLSGAVYAETYMRWAAEAQSCLVIVTMALAMPPCNATAGRPPMSSVAEGSSLYNDVIDAWSMRHWSGRNGHDQFFATFARFALATGRVGDMLADVTSRAAAEHVSYLEVMLGTDGGEAARRIAPIGWNRDLRRMRDRLLSTGFRVVTSDARRRLDDVEARQREALRCATPQADPGCAVIVRYVSQVYRAAPREQVFAQMLAAFELAGQDPRVVSLNLVAPEDDPVAVTDFSTHMRMLSFLHGLYPAVPITLHAGELVKGLVSSDALRLHIRDSIEIGHAQRIGHGLDVMEERNPQLLLRELAARRVLVEIALSSNDLILGVRGKDHPLRTYLEYDVPVAIVTDDEGVARSSHTREFLKAIEEQGLDYLMIKRLVRNSLEYAFADPQTKGRLQSDLEAAFTAFEQRQSHEP